MCACRFTHLDITRLDSTLTRLFGWMRVAEARMVANFRLRPGDANSANNVLQFIESTLHHLGSKTVGLLRADSGFYDQAVFKLLAGKGINYIISARLTRSLQ